MMNEEIIQKSRNAYYGYMREKIENIESKIVEYIIERIKANEDSINNIIKITKEKCNIEEIEKLKQRTSEYKKERNFTISPNGFARGKMTMSKGVILVEESEVEKVIEQYINAVLTRNAIIISDREYNEISVKNLILLIVKEALKKFEVSENLVELMPYEEINEKEFNQYTRNSKQYIYIEDRYFETEARKEEGEILEGDIEEVIERINQEGICKGAVIYTTSKEKGYEFINKVNGENVFVNASLVNIQEGEVSDWYITKNIIYPYKEN